MKIQAFKTRFDPILLDALKARIDAYSQRCPDVFLGDMNRNLNTLMASGGKRVRPYIASAVYEMLGGEVTPAILELFASLEFFHLFALIHDDIIDHGSERHGVATLHRFIQDHLVEQNRKGDLEHISRGQAMLLGDFLHACAHRQLQTTASITSVRRKRLQEEFAHMVEEVMLGEALDVDMTTRSEVTADLIKQKMYLKTASYTFVRPMRMGVILAGGSKKLMRFCEDFGKYLGLAFQIQDDLLDLTASAETIHKTVFSDLREHQHTVFTQYIFEKGSQAEREALRSLLGSPVSEKDRARVEELFHKSGAIEYGRALMTKYFEKAEASLKKLPLEDARKQPLEELLAYIRRRAY